MTPALFWSPKPTFPQPSGLTPKLESWHLNALTGRILNHSGIGGGGLTGAPPSPRSHARGSPHPTESDRLSGRVRVPAQALRAGWRRRGHSTPFSPAGALTAPGGNADRAPGLKTELRGRCRWRGSAGRPGGGRGRGERRGRPPPRTRARPPAPSRAGSPADVSWAMCSAPAWRRAGEPERERGQGGAAERRKGRAGEGKKLALLPRPAFLSAVLPSPIPGCTAAPSAAHSDSTSSCRPRWGCCASVSQSIPSDGPSWGEGAALVSQRLGGGGKAPGEHGGSRVGPVPVGGGSGPETHTHAHTHLFFSNLLWTSLVPILKPRQTGRRFRGRAQSGSLPAPCPHSPNATGGLLPKFSIQSSNGRCSPCAEARKPPGGHMYAHNSQSSLTCHPALAHL